MPIKVPTGCSHRDIAALLFDKSINRPVAHTNDPVTSYMAGEEIEKSGKAAAQREMVYNALKRQNGATSAELAFIMNVDRHLPARRLSELKRVGRITMGSDRICSVCKKLCVTWWIKK